MKLIEKIVLKRLLKLWAERLDKMPKNFKTTLMGCLAAAAALIDATMAQIDGVASTEPNWGLVVATTITAVGLLFSKDAK